MVSLRELVSLDLRNAEGAPLKKVLTQTERASIPVYFLLARPGRLHRRDTLLSLFWPEFDEPHARAALSQALSFLRRERGQEGEVNRT